MSMLRSLPVVLVLSLAPPAIAAGGEPPEDAPAGRARGESEEERRERLMKAWDEVVTTFVRDPAARVPAGDLPAAIAERLDADGDGVITGQEYREARRRMSSPQDRSDFTHIEEGGFPLNLDPEIVPAGEAGLHDDDIVMGVVIDGQARAYPVNYMNGPHNEVVNDTLGGTPIAPSW